MEMEEEELTFSFLSIRYQAFQAGAEWKNQNLVICADYINTTTKIKN